MPYQTITASSVGTSLPSVLNWRCGAPASVSVIPSAAGTSSATFVLQYTLDDLQTVLGASNANWQGVSSTWGTIVNASGSTFTISTSQTNGILVQFQTPVAAVRLSVASLTGSILMKVMQGESW